MIATSPSIIILIPYYGCWPFWMPFFLESCRYNPDIQWLLIGDCDALNDLPSNVRFKRCSFGEYCNYISDRLKLRFSPVSPYKLCDLKPAFGYIHQEEIADYDYWGFSDLDLIYGSLRRYFTDKRLARYKLFSTHKRRISGHFCLMRNEQKMLEAFRRIPDWTKRASDPKNHALDEGGFSRIFLWRKNFPHPLHEFVGLFNPWRRQSEFLEAYSTPYANKPWVDGSFDFPRQWLWDKGSLTTDRDGSREFPYLHFLSWKKQEWQSITEESLVTYQALSKQERWGIDADGFHSS